MYNKCRWCDALQNCLRAPKMGDANAEAEPAWKKETNLYFRTSLFPKEMAGIFGYPKRCESIALPGGNAEEHAHPYLRDCCFLVVLLVLSLMTGVFIRFPWAASNVLWSQAFLPSCFSFLLWLIWKDASGWDQGDLSWGRKLSTSKSRKGVRHEKNLLLLVMAFSIAILFGCKGKDIASVKHQEEDIFKQRKQYFIYFHQPSCEDCEITQKKS